MDNDEELVRLKVKTSPEYKEWDPVEAEADFCRRINEYKKVQAGIGAKLKSLYGPQVDLHQIIDSAGMGFRTPTVTWSYQ